MKQIQDFFTMFQSPDFQVITSLELIPVHNISSSHGTLPDVVSNSKIYSCEDCAKIFKSHKRLLAHYLKSNHLIRSKRAKCL